jgi:hypothetical protein
MPGFSTTCLHGGWSGDPATTAGGVPVYRTAPFKFKNTVRALPERLRGLSVFHSKPGLSMMGCMGEQGA